MKYDEIKTAWNAQAEDYTGLVRWMPSAAQEVAAERAAHLTGQIVYSVERIEPEQAADG